ncbi:MAG: TIGR01777 family oxidoreductase [Planctomycetes bacterium]|nr:TIGR01777 family oxidoreductase [Planctomycetota bacterium]
MTATVAISGASGLIGTTLATQLVASGLRVRKFTRKDGGGQDAIHWDPARGALLPAQIDGLDAIVHLAGESIAGGRWTAARMARIRDSRVQGTRLIATTIAQLQHKPKVLVCASAVGFYGDRGDTEVDESSPPGTGFLAEVCQQWEAAAKPAQDAGVRVVWLRFGVVLAVQGGALERMLLPFKLGLGGRLGSGRQWMPWIAVTDAVTAIEVALARNDMKGVYNVVAPEAVTNATFTRTLARVLRRPAILPVPAFALRLALGRFADEALLSGSKVLPKRLVDAGFRYKWPQLEPALRNVLEGSP